MLCCFCLKHNFLQYHLLVAVMFLISCNPPELSEPNPLLLLHYDFHNVCQLCLLIIKNIREMIFFLFLCQERKSLKDKQSGSELRMMYELLIV